ncbi:hypothetical protein AKJ16_DCAP15565 [Drosera capensis]
MEKKAVPMAREVEKFLAVMANAAKRVPAAVLFESRRILFYAKCVNPGAGNAGNYLEIFRSSFKYISRLEL